MPKMMNFSAHVMSVFESMKTDYESMSNLMTDLALGRTMYDAEADKEITKAEANAKVLEFSRQILQISDIKDRKAVRRAIRDNGRAFYDIIEDTLDISVTTGLQEAEWFQTLVEDKSIAYGDRQDFYAEEDGVLAIAKVGESHHDHILQRLTAGQRYTISTARYGVAIGIDLNKYLLGETNFETMVAAITKAFILKIQEEVYAEVKKAVASLPVNTFKGTGVLNASTKERFDAIIENVGSVNGSGVIIVGTKTALRKLNGLADVNYISAAQKDAVAKTGILGDYEGTTLVEVPQRFTDKTLTTRLFDDNELYILPNVDNRFIKFVDEGDTEVVETGTEKGMASGRNDDIKSYEVQRRFGVATVVAKNFGAWTIAA